jgi:hypothetical protein
MIVSYDLAEDGENKSYGQSSIGVDSSGNVYCGGMTSAAAKCLKHYDPAAPVERPCPGLYKDNDPKDQPQPAAAPAPVASPVPAHDDAPTIDGLPLK